jgi:hypothetical protein
VAVADVGAVALDGGVGAVAVGDGVLVVGAGVVVVGVSGKCSVSDGGCPVRVAPAADDVETLAPASRAATAMAVTQPTDGNPLRSAVSH